MKSVAVQTYLSTAAAARALGVGVSTIKRWVDDGILPAHRTSGGHRKLLRAEILSLARQGKLPIVDIAPLLSAGADDELDPAVLRTALTRATLSGDESRILALLRRARDVAMPLDALADHVIAPVMERVGNEWECQRIDVWQEHRGTQLIAAALHDWLGEIAPPASHHRPLAIAAAPAGDPYFLALLLVQMALIDSGWHVVNLGPNTPLASLEASIEKLRPRLVCLSVSHLADTPQFLREYRSLQQRASRLGAAIAVGGQAMVASLREQLVYTMFGDGITQLVQFSSTLHPALHRPRRGRPSKTRGSR